MDEKERSEFEAEEEELAAKEAAVIGGRAGDEDLDAAQRPLIEAGEGVSEGFELAEEDLVEAAEHTDVTRDPVADAFPSEADGELEGVEYGEPDHEESSEAPAHDR